MRRFCLFCERFGISTQFPVTEQLLCSFVAYLADEGLSPQTVKWYIAAVRNAQLSLGLPDPRETSAFPILKRVQARVSRLRLQQGDSARVRLPITAELLSRIRVALQTSSDPERSLFWEICCTAFFGFFRFGELLLSSVSEFNDSLHLGWGDVAFDHPSRPTMARIHLRQSKTDQSGRGCHIIVGRTETELCPISAILSCLHSGRPTWPILHRFSVGAYDQGQIHLASAGCSDGDWCFPGPVCWTQFPDWGGYRGRLGRGGGLDNSDLWPLAECSVFEVHLHARVAHTLASPCCACAMPAGRGADHVI
jgi:hypothetical protein